MHPIINKAKIINKKSAKLDNQPRTVIKNKHQSTNSTG
jgi:hypothetical protein